MARWEPGRQAAVDTAGPQAHLPLAALPEGRWRWVPEMATSRISVGAVGRLVGQHGQPGCLPPAPG